MTAFLDQVTVFMGYSIDWLELVLATISASPVLTVMCIGIPMVSFAVSLIGRLIRV